MQTTEKLNKIYSLYAQWNYAEAKKYNDEILLADSGNIYAKRYENLLTQKIKSQIEPERKWPIPTVKWKSLKCPHCVAKISFSWLTQWQKDRIRNKDLDNLEIKCPYCHTSFMLQNRKVKSILWIKLWDKINYKQKSYRTTGYIEYQWNWYQWSYSGKLYYIEWILLWSDNSYLYFSEWYSIDDGEKVYEFDFSQKTVPKHPLSVDFDWKKFYSQGVETKMKEYSKVSVKSAYWENSKSYKIWESVLLAPHSDVSWKKYVYEQESSWNQTEVWIYNVYKTNESLARKIFNKQWKIKRQRKSNFGEHIWNYLNWFFILLFLVVMFESFITWKTIGYFIGVLVLWLFIYNIPKIQSSNWSNWWMKLLLIGLFGPIFMLVIVKPLTNIIIEKKEQVHIEHLGISKKSELNLSSSIDKNKKTTSSTKYDYGGVRTYYQENSGIKFSVQSDEDIAVINKVIDNSNNKFWNLSQNEEKINELFKWNLYKLK